MPRCGSCGKTAAATPSARITAAPRAPRAIASHEATSVSAPRRYSSASVIVRSMTAIRVEEHQGPRGELRALFELAEDSARQLDAYIEAGRVLVAIEDD